jgi:hypothetical protein
LLRSIDLTEIIVNAKGSGRTLASNLPNTAVTKIMIQMKTGYFYKFSNRPFENVQEFRNEDSGAEMMRQEIKDV